MEKLNEYVFVVLENNKPLTVYLNKEIAQEFIKKLSAVSNLEYRIKKVKI